MVLKVPSQNVFVIIIIITTTTKLGIGHLGIGNAGSGRGQAFSAWGEKRVIKTMGGQERLSPRHA